MKRHLNRLAPLLALLLLLAPIVRAQAPSDVEPHEAWYVLKLGGQKAGHMHTRLYEEDGKLVTTSDMTLSIKRGRAEMRIEQRSTFVETKDHQPIRSTNAMKLAQMANEQTIDFTREPWVVTATNAGQTNETTMAPPEVDWLTPGGVAAYTKRALDNGEKTIKVTTLDPSMGVNPVTVEMTRGVSKDIEVFGRVIPATRWTVTMSALPGVEIEQWTDADGQPVKQTIPIMPGMEVQMLLADKQLATAEFDAPEMLAASLITPDKPIENPRKLKRAVFELVAEDLKETLGETVPNDGYQRTQWVDDKTLRITIDLDQPVQNEEANPWRPVDQYTASTTMLNYKDDAVEKLIKQVVDPDDIRFAKGNRSPDPFMNALHKYTRALRDVAREHIEDKDLSVGFASASETARTATGDCTEHACLLAAMLRGAGFQSRTVTGLVYADQFAGREGVFGFHMWTQVGFRDDAGDYWLDLDAAAPGEVNGFDATHIALSTSAMKDGESFNDMVTLLPLMRGMQINVLETEWAE